MAAKDEENIYNENDKFLESWNQGDAKAAATFFMKMV